MFKYLQNSLNRHSTNLQSLQSLSKTFCNQANKEVVTDNLIQEILRQRFPAAKLILVEDTSGGCGAMFNVSIETKEFKGLTIMKQHKLVYEVLKDQLKVIHGLHLETIVPKS